MFKLNLVEETFSSATLETDKQRQDHFALPYHALYENDQYELDISYPPTYAYDIMHNNINPTLICRYIRRKGRCHISVKNNYGAHALSKNAYKIELLYIDADVSTREAYEEAFEIVDEFNACVHKWFPDENCIHADLETLLREKRKFL